MADLTEDTIWVTIQLDTVQTNKGEAMKRFIMYSKLKPDKIEEYVRLHREPWKEILELISECNITNYSISIRNDELYTYYEYVGTDYEADMEKMNSSSIMQKWWTHTKPCFLYHNEGKYYEDL